MKKKSWWKQVQFDDMMEFIRGVGYVTILGSWVVLMFVILVKMLIHIARSPW
jgi:hypothetical protein